MTSLDNRVAKRFLKKGWWKHAKQFDPPIIRLGVIGSKKNGTDSSEKNDDIDDE